jgi:hypothetical protein
MNCACIPFSMKMQSKGNAALTKQRMCLQTDFKNAEQKRDVLMNAELLRMKTRLAELIRSRILRPSYARKPLVIENADAVVHKLILLTVAFNNPELIRYQAKLLKNM